MTAQEIRTKYIEFFEAKQHKAIPRASLYLKDDPTTLFTGSGMQPLIPYLLGEEHPDGVRLVDSQTCFRGQDVEEVGDNSHTTFFEMLGNWSLGDYTKAEQIPWLFEFLVDVVGLDPKKLYVSCFIGSEKDSIPRDDESANIWKELFESKKVDANIVEVGSAKDGDEKGMQNGRIFFYNDGENWWSRNGGLETTPIGDPCGPDSEVFYDFGPENHDESYGQPHPASDSGRFMEIGNQVFMQYRRTENGFEPLEKKNVDFGGGLERIAAAAIDSPDVFKISLLWPIVEKLEQLSGKKYDDNLESMRVIADHLRGATFLAADGVTPSNKEQGYVMRRLIRRAVRFAHELGIENNFLQEIVPVVADLYHNDFPEVAESREKIIDTLVKEEKAFRQTLRKGTHFLRSELENIFNKYRDKSSEDFVIPKPETFGKLLFKMYDQDGYPYELGFEMLSEELNSLQAQGLPAYQSPFPDDVKVEFDRLMQEQRQRSQTAAKGTFKGGLADHSDETKKLHTATHLMYEALRRVLGDHVVQRGSNVTAERTRFDFSHDQKVTREQLDEVEKIVNEQIEKDLTVSFAEYPTDEAFKMGAKGAFGDKYGDTVKVYTMKAENEEPFSVEICGGPHVEHTGQLGENGKHFKVKKEEASSAGVRRIKAILA